MTRPILLLAATLFVTACGTTGYLSGNDRQEDYVRKHTLTEKDSLHVMEGRIYEGMPINHALAALGPPSRQDTTTAADGSTRIEYMYRARANAFDPGNLHRAYVYATNQTVSGWKDLNKVPRFDAYYEGGM
jgi:hypothetical protein